MLSVLLAVFGFLAAMVPLVVIHEFGHFWVAKRLGVKILRFSVGFGRVLWSRKIGPDQTEWALSAIPLGGYVKMLDENEGEVAPAELDRAFNRQPLWKRSLIVLAGPMANLLLAFAVYSGMLMLGVQQLRPVVYSVQPASLAQTSGFRPGETIVAIDGRPVAAWSEVDIYLLLKAMSQGVATVDVRQAQGGIYRHRLDFGAFDRRKIGPNFSAKLGLSVLPVREDAVVGFVAEKRAAEKAGLRAGDVVKSVAGQPVHSWEQMSQIILAHPNARLSFEVDRRGRRLNLTVVSESETRDAKKVGVVGIGRALDDARFRQLVFTQRLGLVEAAERSWTQGRVASRLTLEMMGRMVLGQVSTDNLSGPIGIASMAGETLRTGWQSFLGFLAVMSLSLGLLNLLPVPILDGGHLVYYLLEAIWRRPLPERAMLIGQRVGLLLLALLTFLAFYNDLHRLLF